MKCITEITKNDFANLIGFLDLKYKDCAVDDFCLRVNDFDEQGFNGYRVTPKDSNYPIFVVPQGEQSGNMSLGYYLFWNYIQPHRNNPARLEAIINEINALGYTLKDLPSY